MLFDSDFSSTGCIGSPQQTTSHGSHSHPPAHGFSTRTTSPHSLHSYLSPFSPFCFAKKSTSQKNSGLFRKKLEEKRSNKNSQTQPNLAAISLRIFRFRVVALIFKFGFNEWVWQCAFSAAVSYTKYFRAC